MMSSLFVGATGMKSHSEGMGVISNNLSNVNTLGYKQMAMQYADLMSQYMTTGGGNLTNTSQKGLGAAPGSIRTLFTQGGAENGSASTDLRIEGKGFFGVAKGDAVHYTRAGNFRFDNEGALLDASGWNVLGRPIVNGAASAETQPIKLDISVNGKGYMPPRATSAISTGSSLGGLEDSSSTEDNPFFDMAVRWNGALETPLAPGRYSYAEQVEFYDANGTLQKANLYYDKAGTSNGSTAVEYVLALDDPSLDGSALAGTRAAGLLMAGTITFGPNGAMTNMTAFTPPASGNPADLSGWVPAGTQNGQPAFTVQPAGATAQTIALDMGFTYGSGSTGAGLASAAEAAANEAAIYGASTGATLTDNASNGFGDSPATLHAGKDGYPEGTLKDVTVTSEGIVRGIYSNGQSDDLYQVSLYRFISEDGLRHEGNSHYATTQESGLAEEGLPGSENFGSISGNALEQSNVDYAREFSLMIVNQRGFQMNSKVITTSDTMLQKALELKR